MIPLTILIIVIFFTEYFKNKEGNAFGETISSFDYSKTKLLKAILPFFIIMHHSLHSGSLIVLGEYVVGIFFFLSGHGLETKKISMGGLSPTLIVRLLKVLIPLVLPICLFLIEVILLEKVSFPDFLSQVNGYRIILPYSWFVLSLIQLYILYYISYYICKSPKYNLFITSTVIITYILVLYLFHIPSTYYCSLPGFLAGVFFAHCSKSNIISLAYQKSVIPIIGILLLFSCAIISLANIRMSILVILILYCYSLALLLSIIQPINSRIIDFFSSISYELYLCQGISFSFLHFIGMDDKIIFTILSILLTIPIAWLCNKGTSFLIHLFRLPPSYSHIK